MGNNRNPRVLFACEYCGKQASDRPSHYARKKLHFCSVKCYANYRRDVMPKEEQNAYGHGFNPEERTIRALARSTTNHAIRDGKLVRKPCQICGNDKTEAHHDDYSKPLEVKWFCFKHHRQYHHENPELLEVSKC
jgi:hypothetical protein